MFAIRRVKVVFNKVIAAAGQVSGDVCPFVAQFSVQLKYEALLSSTDLVLIDVRVQVVMPPTIK